MGLQSASNSMSPLILQFGTSRFLQAHVDYFVGKSLDSNKSNASIFVVQTSDNPAGKERVAVMNNSVSYPVRIQGLQNGKVINQEEQVRSIEGALQANSDWDAIVQLFCERVTHVVSNTADQGYVLSDSDNETSSPPISYPAKLLVLLLARYQNNQRPVTMMPCELIANNGSVLKELVISIATSWNLDSGFIDWLNNNCLWINSLVDRIVSEPIEPLGAVAEPYALWAIEDQPGLELPCQHDAIRIVKDLAPLEWLKLSILNLSHTFLVDIWQQCHDSGIETVAQIMNHRELRASLENVLQDEVIPVLEAMDLGEDVKAYAESVRERFLNPFLVHKLSDIAANHESKVERRILPLYKQGLELLPELEMSGLTQCLIRNGLISGESK